MTDGLVEMAADRMPADPWLRIQADRLIARAYALNGEWLGCQKKVENKLTPFWARIKVDYTGGEAPPKPPSPGATRVREAIPGLVAALVAAGHFSIDEQGNLRIAPNERYRDHPLPKQGMLVAFAERMAERHTDDPAKREAIATLFLNLRALHAVHATADGGLVASRRFAAAILVPRVIGLDPVRGAVIRGAHVIVRDAKGRLSGRWATEESIAVSFSSRDRAVVTITGRLDRGRQGNGILGDLPLSTIPSRTPRHYAAKMEPEWEGFGSYGERGPSVEKEYRVAKGVAAGLLGFQMEPAAWRSFAASVRRSRKLGPSVSHHLVALVEDDVRAACLRSPKATIRLANWFAADGGQARTRRIQASASYPILTPYLHLAEAEIDGGAPLAPALSRTLGLHPRLVRKLSGCRWQAVGRGYDRLFTTSEMACRVSALAEAIPPERLPSKRAQWQGFLHAAEVLHDQLGWPAHPRLARDASADWERLRALSDAGLRDSVRTVSQVLASAVRGPNMARPFQDYPMEDGLAHAVRKALVEAILGDGSIGRLERFNELFHRGIAARSAKIREIEVAEHETNGSLPVAEPPRTWLPMTVSPFVSGGGRMEWVTDVDALCAEGDEMTHCVGCHAPSCRSGHAHVAKVFGHDGGRTTVEFVLQPRRGAHGWEVSLYEHKAFHNDPPPPDCTEVVSAFLSVADGLVDGQMLMDGGIEYREWSARYGLDQMSPQGWASVLAVYDDCLPGSARGIPPAGWRERISEVFARPREPERAGATIAERHRFVNVNPKYMD